uniref:Peptidase S1 domain-containing protein n=1 Tax=Anopheles dirus TaxID=7168 RepID=A0A182NV07_9DIPT
MSKYVQPVCVWNLNDQEYPIIGENGTIVGFGLTENDTVSNHLKKGLVSVVEPLECIENDRRGFAYVLTSEMICGKGQNGVSACNGDSGGGMFFEVSGKWFVRGLVSFTPGRENNSLLCDGIRNTVFSDVARYEGWINQYIDPRVVHDVNEVIVDYDEKLKLFDFDTCGTTNYPFYPYGLLKKQSGFAMEKPCFVTLISRWYAVGPARCFSNNRDRHEVDGFGQIRQIERVMIHPKFDSATYANDIALIELTRPLNDRRISPICLPIMPEMRIKKIDNLFQWEGNSVTVLSHNDCKARNTVLRSVLPDNQDCGELELDSMEIFEGYDDFDGISLHQVQTRGDKKQMFLRGVQTLGYYTNTSMTLAFIDTNDYIDWILHRMRFIDREENEDRLSLYSEESKEPEWKSDNKWLDISECGSIDDYYREQIRSHVPWIGWLHINRNVTIAELSHGAVATLIHRRFALAAAAIMENKEQWRFLTLGALSNYYSCRTDYCEDLIQELDVREITIHPNYTKHPRRNDIALIEVWPEIYEYHEYIRPICLPWTKNLPRNQLKQINSTSCQRRFMLNHYHVEEEDISICTIYADGEEPAAIVPGAPLQDEMVLANSDERQWFLRGLSYDHLERKRMTDERTTHIPQLFTDINPFIDWIAEEVKRVYDERSRMLSKARSKAEHLKSDQVFLSAIRNTEKRRLFDFETCGADIREAPGKEVTRNIPWLGLIHRTNEIGEAHACGVILISDRYGISTASCAVNYTGNVVFPYGEATYHYSIQKIIAHPEYRAGDLNHNIAVIQLQKSANLLNPICLPIIDEIRTLGYNRTGLSTLWYNYYRYKEFLSVLQLHSVGDRYVDSIYCQFYRNESTSKFERQQSMPLHSNSSICISSSQHYSFRGLESKVEGSPIFSEHVLNGVKRLFLRGISLQSGRMKPFASMFYLEIDGFLDWILDNMNDTLRLNEIPFDLREKLLFN